MRLPGTSKVRQTSACYWLVSPDLSRKEPSPLPDERAIVNYLRRGLLISAAATMRQRDLLDPSKFVPVATDGHRSDGRWVWHTHLGYYLRTYHVALPDSFLSHGRARGWEPGPKEEVDVRAITIAMIRDRLNPAP